MQTFQEFINEVKGPDNSTHISSGNTSFMKRHAGVFAKHEVTIHHRVHDEDSGTSEFHVSGHPDNIRKASKELESKDSRSSYGGLIKK